MSTGNNPTGYVQGFPYWTETGESPDVDTVAVLRIRGRWANLPAKLRTMADTIEELNAACAPTPAAKKLSSIVGE